MAGIMDIPWPDLDEEEPAPSEAIYVMDLPPSTTEESLRGMFGPGVVQCRVSPSKGPGQPLIAQVRFSSVKEAILVRETLHGAIPPGQQRLASSRPVAIRFCGQLSGSGAASFGKAATAGAAARSSPYDKGGAKGGAFGSGQKETPQPNDNLFITGLPPGIDNAALQTLFGQHGKVVQCKVLATTSPTACPHALVRFSSTEEAAAVKKKLTGYALEGVNEPLIIEFALQKPRMGQAGWGCKGGMDPIGGKGCYKGGYDGWGGKGYDDGSKGWGGKGYDDGSKGGWGKGDCGGKGWWGGKGYDDFSKGWWGGKGYDDGCKGGWGGKFDGGSKGSWGFKGDDGSKGGWGCKGDDGSKGGWGCKGSLDDGAKGGWGGKGCLDDGGKGGWSSKGGLDDGSKGGWSSKGGLDDGSKGGWGGKGGSDDGGKGGWGGKGGSDDGGKGGRGGKDTAADGGKACGKGCSESSEPVDMSQFTPSWGGIERILKGFQEAQCLPGHDLGNEDNCLFVSGLPKDCDDIHLYRLMAPFGGITPIGVKAMKHTDGTCKGFGFVNFVQPSSVQAAALMLHGTQLPDGSTMSVVPKKSKKEKTDAPRVVPHIVPSRKKELAEEAQKQQPADGGLS